SCVSHWRVPCRSSCRLCLSVRIRRRPRSTLFPYTTLFRAAGRVVAIEIDSRLIPILEEVLAPYDNVVLIHADALKIDLRELWRTHFQGLAGVSAVANLPYYAAAPILMALLESRLPWERLVLMVQKEIADRICAAPGGKDYGSLSVAVQYRCEAEPVCRVPPGAF